MSNTTQTSNSEQKFRRRFFKRSAIATLIGGIAASFRERVFEPFYRRTGTKQSIGAGLGLALLVRQIARRHGGEARTQGSCFVVVLSAGRLDALRLLIG